MSKLLERLDELYLRKPTKRGELQYDRYQRLASALVDAYPKLRAVVEAAEDFMNSDGDYFAWTEDERHCMSRLRDAVLALKEDV